MAVHGGACLSVSSVVVELLYVVLVGRAITVPIMGEVSESAQLQYEGAPHLRCAPRCISAAMARIVLSRSA
jgi:hypothetical protein